MKEHILKLLIALALSWVALSAQAGPVNINTANIESLAKNIKGVGVKKAQAIILYRKAHGPFKRVDDLAKVKGIGAKLLEKNRADLRITAPKVKKN